MCQRQHEMAVSVLNLWLTAFEVRLPLSLLAPHQGQLLNKISLLQELSYGDSSIAEKKLHQSEWYPAKWRSLCGYKLFSNRIICSQLGNYGMYCPSSAKEQNTAPSQSTCRQVVKKLCFSRFGDRSWSLELISSWILGSQTCYVVTGCNSLNLRITLQLTKWGDSSRTGVCTIEFITGFLCR